MIFGQGEEEYFVFYNEEAGLGVMGHAGQLKAQWERKKSLPFQTARGEINARAPHTSRS